MNRLSTLFEKVQSLGVRDTYLPWENHLVRKVNTMSIIGITNTIFSILLFFLIDIPQVVLAFVVSFIICPIILLLNMRFHYLWATYFIIAFSYLFQVYICLLLTVQSGTYLHYFPLIITAIQLFGRKELIKHFVISSLIGIFSVVFIAYGSYYHIGEIELSSFQLVVIFGINLFISILTTIGFSLTIAKENLEKENDLNKLIKDKELLLAELFHRVKNNLNVVISLINLKEHEALSEEAKTVLIETRNRIYSIALIHERIFNNKREFELELKPYFEELIEHNLAIFGNQKKTVFNIDCAAIQIDLNKAFPCGMIVNELITNSLKHANSKDILEIHLSLFQNGNSISLTYKDNGQGLEELDSANCTSMGMTLIHSLTEQLDGDCQFINDDGLTFNLKFTI